jgi:hypothetical protein
MRRALGLAVVLGVMATACGGSSEPVRYYDPWRNFTVDIPVELAAVGPAGPQAVDGIGNILSGVIASEPEDTSSAPAFGISQQTQPTIAEQIQLAVLDGRGFVTPDDMVGLEIATDTADVIVREPLQLGGVPALLLVVDHSVPEVGGVLSVAAVFAVDGEKAYWISHVFPFGTWEQHKATLFRFVRSFRFGVPARVHLEQLPA